MSSSTPLPFALPEPAKPVRAPRVARAQAGQRTIQRRGQRTITSVELKARDEVALDELRRIYGVKQVGAVLRLAMYEALEKRGVDVDALDQGAAV